MRLVATIILAFALPQAVVAGEDFTVTYDGIGPVRIGMTKAEVSRIAGEPIERSPGAGDAECEYFYAPHHLPGVKFMFSREQLARIDVVDGATPTQAGVRIGDTLAKIKKAYRSRVSMATHQYIPEPDGKYVTARSPSGKRAIRFETDKGRVVTYYVGRFPEVEYVEGCL